jgi:hypothetical protein
VLTAHHQNGRVEKSIRDIQDLARSSILHAKQLWPDAIEVSLWPYAIRKCANDMNHIKNDSEIMLPLSKLSGSNVHLNIKNFHTFGCPMYVLDTNRKDILSKDVVERFSKSSKWNARARMAIYIGPSPNHASSIGLALSLLTGLVSPVFHAKYDDVFQTVTNAYDRYVTKSVWQVRCGFQKGTIQESLLTTKTEVNKQEQDVTLEDVHVDNDEKSKIVGISNEQSNSVPDLIQGNDDNNVGIKSGLCDVSKN